MASPFRRPFLARFGQIRRLLDAPLPERRSDFAQLTESDLSHFRALLSENGVKTEDIDGFNEDMLHWYKGRSPVVLLPQSAEEVSAVLRHCFQRRLAVVPQAGNTGLVGGSVPMHDELILSTKRLNRHFAFDESSGILDCDAGFVLEEADNRLSAHSYMVPIDLGAKGSCLVGGIAATNAGGIRLIRYGSMHANVTGLQVVLPDESGSILQLGSQMRKDNTELHLHKLFVGSEGQLGVITRVQMQAVPRPLSVHSAFLGVPSFEQCRQILVLAKRQLNEILSSFELIDAEALKVVEEHIGLSSPLGANFPFHLLVETSGSSVEHDSAKMDAFLGHCLEAGLASDGVLAGSAAEAEHLWKLREHCSHALRQEPFVYKHDVSLPLEHFYALTEAVRSRLEGRVKTVVTFGHLGDGNSHLNIVAHKFDQQLHDLVYPFLYEWVVARGGSISAEHGIGRAKREYHHRLVDVRRRQLSSQLKRLFDPRAILSPYKMVD